MGFVISQTILSRTPQIIQVIYQAPLWYTKQNIENICLNYNDLDIQV